MLKNLEAVLAAAAIAATPIALSGCDGGDGETEATDAGCPGSTDGCPGATDGCPGTSAGCPGAIPTEPAALLTWLEDGNYSGWPAESAVHASTGSSPHGPVKIFINQALSDSLTANNTEHPEGVAAVKELYDADMVTPIGWSVYVKTQADSDGGNGWYWYDYQNGAVNMEGQGLGGCVGCHSTGVDYVTVPFPLG